jgi:hypothetical protein
LKAEQDIADDSLHGGIQAAVEARAKKDAGVM